MPVIAVHILSHSHMLFQLHIVPQLVDKDTQPADLTTTCLFTSSTSSLSHLYNLHIVPSWRPYKIRALDLCIPFFLLSKPVGAAELFSFQKWIKDEGGPDAIFVPQIVRELKSIRISGSASLTYSICGGFIVAIWSQWKEGIMAHSIKTSPCAAGEVDTTTSRKLVPSMNEPVMLAVSPWSGTIFCRPSNDTNGEVRILQYA